MSDTFRPTSFCLRLQLERFFVFVQVWMMFRVKAKDKLEEVEEQITDMKVGLENWSGRKNGPKNMKDMRQSLRDLIK